MPPIPVWARPTLLRSPDATPRETTIFFSRANVKQALPLADDLRICMYIYVLKVFLQEHFCKNGDVFLQEHFRVSPLMPLSLSARLGLEVVSDPWRRHPAPCVAWIRPAGIGSIL